MTRLSVAVAVWILICGASSALECSLDHAIYTEPQSGGVISFQPKTPEYGLMTSGVFDLSLPNIKTIFRGDITWNLGKFARPDASIARPCLAEISEAGENCFLWYGNVYSVGNESVGLIDDDAMMAPHAMLLVDFGRSLMWNQEFTAANPQSVAMDLFSLTSCTP